MCLFEVEVVGLWEEGERKREKKKRTEERKVSEPRDSQTGRRRWVPRGGRMIDRRSVTSQHDKRSRSRRKRRGEGSGDQSEQCSVVQRGAVRGVRAHRQDATDALSRFVWSDDHVHRSNSSFKNTFLLLIFRVSSPRSPHLSVFFCFFKERTRSTKMLSLILDRSCPRESACS